MPGAPTADQRCAVWGCKREPTEPHGLLCFCEEHSARYDAKPSTRLRIKCRHCGLTHTDLLAAEFHARGHEQWRRIRKRGRWTVRSTTENPLSCLCTREDA